MPAELESIRSLIRRATPGTTLVMAPDVHDAYMAGRSAHEATSITGPHQNIQIRRSNSVPAGKVVAMSPPARIKAGSFAGEFLAKSGPGKPHLPLGAPVVVDMKPPPPPAPPAPPQEPPPGPRPQGPRKRIVDT